MLEALKQHWPEYLIEAWCLGTFMLSACGFGVLLFHPDSPVAGLAHGVRNVLMGMAMGTTATAIICSPWGRRSGAHYNPAVTLVFLRLGKIRPADAFFYIVFQFIGGAFGVLLAWIVFGRRLEHAAVSFVVTMPGDAGIAAAAGAEFVIAFILMSTVLIVSNSARMSRFTPFFAGTLVALFIAVESPVSGMSMNPARTFGSAVVAGSWNAWWIYFIVPPIAMLIAAEVFIKVRGLKAVLCAKLDHRGRARCIFNCDFGEPV
jgi:aquaporin Z